MFEQHPVPQQISSYQFRLVGDMTLKQFFQLAAGAVLALLIYATPLPSFFKWPLIIVFVIAGAAFAFLPLQERPLEEWISAFFRAVYGPTLFRWKKDVNVVYFAPAAGATVQTAAVAGQTVNTNPSVSKLETKESTFLSNISDMFSLHPKTAAPVAPTPISVVTEAAPVPVAAPIQVQTHASPQPQILTTLSKPTPLVSYSTPAPKAGTLFVATPVVATIATPRVGFVAPAAAQSTPVVAVQTAPLSQTLRPQNSQESSQVQFSPDAAPPTPATIPNIIVGQVMNANNKIVEGAILEVKDFQGRPVRALKTNKAGHFMIVTPLPSGTYNMTVEKEGLTFGTLTFELHGAIIEPMAIKANQ